MTKEREQQASLALEDAELQKTAIITEADNKVKEIQLELETARTVSLSNNVFTCVVVTFKSHFLFNLFYVFVDLLILNYTEYAHMDFYKPTGKWRKIYSMIHYNGM